MRTTSTTLVDRFDRMLRGFGDRLIQVADLKSGERALDIGCGAGATAEAAARLVGPAGLVTAIDVDPVAVDHAYWRVQRAGLGNVRTIIDDASTYPFPPASFDVAISRFAT